MRCILEILVPKKTIGKRLWVSLDAAKGFAIPSSLTEPQSELQFSMPDIKISFDTSAFKRVSLFYVARNATYIHSCLISPADT
jgi:hypothetical protein